MAQMDFSKLKKDQPRQRAKPRVSATFERNELICEAAKASPYSEVGKRFGISRARVHQIVKRIEARKAIVAANGLQANLTTRAFNVLQNHGVKTVEEFAALELEALFATNPHGCGDMVKAELREYQARLNNG